MALNRVLIVEDTRDVGRYYQDSIRAAFPGVLISLVPSAEEALLESTRYAYDLLISDVRLPGISGLDLVRKIRPRLPEIKIMIITGLRLDAAQEKQSRDLRVDLVMAKPVGLPELIGSIERLCGEQSRLALGQAQPAQTLLPSTGSLKSEQPIPLEPVLPRPGSTEPPSLRVLLADLRASLSAQAVILLDELGNVVEKAGGWPAPDLEARLVPNLLAARGGLDKLSSLMRSASAGGASAIQGENYDLAFAPVDRATLLVFLRASSGALRMALAFEHLLTVQAKLARVLEEMRARERAAGPAVPAVLPVIEQMPPSQKATAPLPAIKLPAEPVEPEDPAALESLSAILGKATGAPPAQDADDFWDQAVSTKKAAVPGEGALTYEQAREMGLLPKE